jgi:hypothetical protein
MREAVSDRGVVFVAGVKPPTRAAPRRGAAIGVDPLLTLESKRQALASHGNGFRLFERLSALLHLRSVGTVCDR